MKRIWLLLCSIAIAAASAPTAQSQVNLVFSSFQCDPLSCVEQGPAETQGSATVNFIGHCTGNVVPLLAVNAQAVIGTPAPCKVPYIPYALVTTSTQEYLDDCGQSYYVDYVTPNAEVFTAEEVLVYHVDATYGCDGSQTGSVIFGTKPC